MSKTEWSIGVVLSVILVALGIEMMRHGDTVEVGMTKAEVITLLGAPRSTRSADGAEYLVYRLSTPLTDAYNSETDDYFVKIVDGRVTEYGQRGYFAGDEHGLDE